MTVSLNSRGHAAHPFISSPGSKHVFFGRTLAPDAENQLAFNAGNRLAPDASLLTSTT